MTATQDLIGMARREATMMATEGGGRSAIRVRTTEGWTVVELCNTEFLFAPEVEAELAGPLHRLVDAGQTRLVLDLTGVRSMSSDVLAIIVDLHRRLGKVGGGLRVVGVGPSVRAMLRSCGLDRYLAVEPDEAGRDPSPRLN